MKTTSVFERNIAEYNSGTRLIINQGGTRSSKTFSILQLLFLIALYSKKELVISIVSYALPHLKLGAIRDFERIITDFGIIPETVRNKTESTYRIGKSIIEFFGADNIGKVHGPERDILYVNEANHIKHDIYVQLAIRTRKTIFIDYNPTREFWVHEEIYHNGLSTQQLYEMIASRGVGSKLIVGDSAATRTIQDLKGKGLNIKPVIKSPILDDIKMLQDWRIIVDPSSTNLVKNLNSWVWLDKKGEIPIDVDDDLIDAGRYYSKTVIKPIVNRPKQKALK